MIFITKGTINTGLSKTNGMDDFLKQYNGTKLKRLNWKKNYVVPIAKVDESKFWGELYDIATGRYLKRTDFDLAEKSPDETWVILPTLPSGLLEISYEEGYGRIKPVEEPVSQKREQHKCHCDLTELLNHGCKCGGI